MPTVEDKFGRILSDDSAEITYVIRDIATDVEARTELLTAAPATHNGLVRSDAQVEEIHDEIWLGTVRYAPSAANPPQAGESSFAFETRGGHAAHHPVPGYRGELRLARPPGDGGSARLWWRDRRDRGQRRGRGHHRAGLHLLRDTLPVTGGGQHRVEGDALRPDRPSE